MNDHIPPTNLESEELLLASMLWGGERIVGHVQEHVGPQDFYRLTNVVVCAAAYDLFERGEPVDTATITQTVRNSSNLDLASKDKICEHVSQLGTIQPVLSNAISHAQIVRANSTYRTLITVGQRISDLGWSHEMGVTDALATAESMLFSVTSPASNQEGSLSALVREQYARTEELHALGRSIIGLPTGFREIDRVTSGLQPGNLVIVGGRPSMGKSALGLAILANVGVRQKLPAMLFTMEMSKAEITQRILCAESKVDLQRLRTGLLINEDWPKLLDACARVEQANVQVDDTGAITVPEIRSRARRMKMRQPDLALVVVDYLQLMVAENDHEGRVQAISKISRELKVMARELEIPVVAMSQLNRQVESRSDKRPVLSDLRDSGSIEQDADIVMFLYRDDYYNELSDTPGVCEVNIAKHRNGPIETVRLSFVKRYAKFVDIAESS